MIVTRFAPSPTGDLHLGGARTALFSWLYAKHAKGSCVLRIEDTDRERSTDASTQVILEAMDWLGLDYDHGPFYQSQRLNHYHDVIDQLMSSGQAYYCQCSSERLDMLRDKAIKQGEKPKYDGHCRHLNLKKEPDSVVRFVMPDKGHIAFDDMIRGRIVFENTELDDFILQRSNGSFTYNFTVVVDDYAMGITHVLRGDDHINNTPKQIHLANALGHQALEYAHMPSILGSDGKRLSKRHGAKNVLEYRDQGILPEALINTLARLGWSHGDQELFSVSELVQLFDLTAVQRSPAGFDEKKLLWINAQHMRKVDLKILLPQVMPFWQQLGVSANGDALETLLQLHLDRCETLKELAEKTAWYFLPLPALDSTLGQSVEKMSDKLFNDVYAEFNKLDNWVPGELSAIMNEILARHEIGFGRLGKPLRAIVVRGMSGVGLVDLLVLLGKTRVVSALEEARQYRLLSR